MILNDFDDQTAFTYLSSEAWNRESEDQNNLWKQFYNNH
jgi:hypothetical protein